MVLVTKPLTPRQRHAVEAQRAADGRALLLATRATEQAEKRTALLLETDPEDPRRQDRLARAVRALDRALAHF